ncbi:MAG: hypothetical protein PVH54_11585 [Gammaproteobacteria bacterium]|jgi:hypothetical protein
MLDVTGMLFANGCTRAHVVAAAAIDLIDQPGGLLNANKYGALM